MVSELQRIRENSRVAYRENLAKLKESQRLIDIAIQSKEDISDKLIMQYESALVKVQEHWKLYISTSKSLKSMGF